MVLGKWFLRPCKLKEKGDTFLKIIFVLQVLAGDLRLMFVLQDVNGEVSRK